MTSTEKEHNNRGKYNIEADKVFLRTKQSIAFSLSDLYLYRISTTTGNHLETPSHPYMQLFASAIFLPPVFLCLRVPGRRVRTAIRFRRIMNSGYNLRIDLYLAVTFKLMRRTVMLGFIKIYILEISRKKENTYRI